MPASLPVDLGSAQGEEEQSDDGELSVADVFSFLAKMVSARRTSLLDLFRDVDADSSGNLDHDEVRELLRLAGLEGQVDETLFNAFFDELDECGDGSITYIEFSRGVEKRKKANDSQLQRILSKDDMAAGSVKPKKRAGSIRKETVARQNEIRLQALLHDHADEVAKKEDVSLAHKRRHMKKLEEKKSLRKSASGRNVKLPTVPTNGSSGSESGSSSSDDELTAAEQQQLAARARAPRMSMNTVNLEVSNLKRDASKAHREREFASQHSKAEADHTLQAKLQQRQMKKGTVKSATHQSIESAPLPAMTQILESDDSEAGLSDVSVDLSSDDDEQEGNI